MLGIPVEEVDIQIGTLARADEAFLSSTTREVQAIAHVDGAAMPVAPGPITSRLASAFRELVTSTPDP
jgi:branched-chain amino acid aminotransferase